MWTDKGIKCKAKLTTRCPSTYFTETLHWPEGDLLVAQAIKGACQELRTPGRQAIASITFNPSCGGWTSAAKPMCDPVNIIGAGTARGNGARRLASHFTSSSYPALYRFRPGEAGFQWLTPFWTSMLLMRGETLGCCFGVCEDKHDRN
jgi:hypothetical protein